MRITILFGGTNKERLVSVASAQALHRALPEADLWFWDVSDTVHEVRSQQLLDHARPFEDEFNPDNSACMAAGPKTASCRRCAKCAAFPSPAPARRRHTLPLTR
jgi:D-alanine-D-alanine ligase-like ATP-grasp enzyme